MSRIILSVGGLIAVISAVAVGLVVNAKVNAQPPCARPSTVMFFSEAVPALAAIELQARDQLVAMRAVRPGVSFNVQVSPNRQEPTVIAGAVQAGNGYVETMFGPAFMGADVVYGFTATRSCDGGGWTVELGKRFAKHKPAHGYTAAGRAKPAGKGRPANPDR